MNSYCRHEEIIGVNLGGGGTPMIFENSLLITANAAISLRDDVRDSNSSFDLVMRDRAAGEKDAEHQLEDPAGAEKSPVDELPGGEEAVEAEDPREVVEVSTPDPANVPDETESPRQVDSGMEVAEVRAESASPVDGAAEGEEKPDALLDAADSGGPAFNGEMVDGQSLEPVTMLCPNLEAALEEITSKPRINIRHGH